MDMPLYFDYAATTPIDPAVAQSMITALTDPGQFGNASSTTHQYGWQAQQLVESARQQVASLIGAKTREITFTSGATEANNIVLQGAVRAFRLKHPGRVIHIITSAIEHKSILDTCAMLEEEGVAVTYLKPDECGQVLPEQVMAARRPSTLLVSLMHVNNEIGNTNPIASIAQFCQSENIFFHVDASQSVGKLPLDLRSLPIDALTFSGHKIYGPKGVGVLFLRHHARHQIAPCTFGGGQERKLRPGTLPTHQIVGIGKACELAEENILPQLTKMDALRRCFLDELDRSGVHYRCNTALAHSYPGIINIQLAGVEPDPLLMGLPQVALSTGSACNSQQKEGSHVLAAIGRDSTQDANLRFSFGKHTTEAMVRDAVKQLTELVKKLLRLSVQGN